MNPRMYDLIWKTYIKFFGRKKADRYAINPKGRNFAILDVAKYMSYNESVYIRQALIMLREMGLKFQQVTQFKRPRVATVLKHEISNTQRTFTIETISLQFSQKEKDEYAEYGEVAPEYETFIYVGDCERKNRSLIHQETWLNDREARKKHQELKKKIEGNCFLF